MSASTKRNASVQPCLALPASNSSARRRSVADWAAINEWPDRAALRAISPCGRDSERDEVRFEDFPLVMAEQLMLKRASASRTSGEWREDDYDVVADGIVVGHIMKAAIAREGTPWMWTLAFGHHEDRTPTHGYEATREAAMAAFAKSWRRE
jgi:hypothetical protein